MKPWMIACGSGVAALVAVAVVWWAPWRPAGDAPAPAAGGSPVAALGVDDFMRHVDRYPGTQLVEGVVSAVAPSDGLVVLIDRAEFEECASTTCATLRLPVRWEGPAPAVGEVVRVAGEAESSSGRLIFAARTMTGAAAAAGPTR